MQTAQHPSTETMNLSVPGKVFLLGEYGILVQKPAIIVTMDPRFEMRVLSRSNNFEMPFSWSPNSPIGRLFHWFQTRELKPFNFEWIDPHQGRGGFGASSAQFLLGYYAQKILSSGLAQVDLEKDWRTIWMLYRELNHNGTYSPSGADLAAQFAGGVPFFDPLATETPVFENLIAPFDGKESVFDQLWVFSATAQEGRKVATHEHLNRLYRDDALKEKKEFLFDIEKLTWEGRQAIEDNNGEWLGSVVNRFADSLRSEDLELELTYRDRQAISDYEGVVGIKGSGALQADAIWVVVDREHCQDDELLKRIESRGLKLVSRGVRPAKGLTCEKTPNHQGG